MRDRDRDKVALRGSIVDFGDPPVIEVALSTEIRRLPHMSLVRIVDAWHELYQDRFPEVQEQARYAPPPLNAERGQRICMMSQLPTPRLWFLNQARTDLIQLQNDWFGRNWRKVEGAEEYPRYGVLREAFAHDLGLLRDFTERNALGSLVPTTCEITYINHIELAPDLGVEQVLGVLSRDGGGFLPKMEAGSLSARFAITDGEHARGTLAVNASTATRAGDNASILALQVTARGNATTGDVAGVLRFLDLGHEWVVRAFAELTTEQMHQRWGRTQ